MNSADFALLDI